MLTTTYEQSYVSIIRGEWVKLISAKSNVKMFLYTFAFIAIFAPIMLSIFGGATSAAYSPSSCLATCSFGMMLCAVNAVTVSAKQYECKDAMMGVLAVPNKAKSLLVRMVLIAAISTMTMSIAVSLSIECDEIILKNDYLPAGIIEHFSLHMWLIPLMAGVASVWGVALGEIFRTSKKAPMLLTIWFLSAESILTIFKGPVQDVVFFIVPFSHLSNAAGILQQGRSLDGNSNISLLYVTVFTALLVWLAVWNTTKRDVK